MSKSLNELKREFADDIRGERSEFFDDNGYYGSDEEVEGWLNAVRVVEVKDAINPSHYQQNGIETIDYMKAYSTPEEFKGHLRLTALKYLSRFGKKDDELQELKKAAWYLDRLIMEME